ncbi:MAG: PIN domain-containing protein [Methanophagales archaeon ANME-1-THS]|nr:MAG: PIN domain-containing protein [Methanophagales archaeon ANME-1-THS]
MIVIDASSLAHYNLREENWATVRDHLATELYSLDLAVAEVSNAIWKHQVFYRRNTHEQALLMVAAVQKLRADVVVFESVEVYLHGALELASSEQIPVYDALYLVQVDTYGNFGTSDRKDAMTDFLIEKRRSG